MDIKQGNFTIKLENILGEIYCIDFSRIKSCLTKKEQKEFIELFEDFYKDGNMIGFFEIIKRGAFSKKLTVIYSNNEFEIVKRDVSEKINFEMGLSSLIPPRELNPSQEKHSYWLHATRKVGEYPKPTDRSGKWLIFVHINEVDEVWDKIKKATEEGKLGCSAKVSTAKPNPNATNTETKVICVYTYDWSCEEDVRRIREELRKLGITNKIPYKADEDTLSGKYRVKGHTRISKYYE